MASLQKIRSHGPLLIIVVGLAMLAFILGDVLTNVGHLRNSGEPQVGSVAGNTISISEFERTKAYLENIQKNNPVGFISMFGYDYQKSTCEQLLSQFQELQKEEGHEAELEGIRRQIVEMANSIDLNATTWNTYVTYYTFKAKADELGLDISADEYAEISGGLPEHIAKGEWLRMKYNALLGNTFNVNSLEAEFAFNAKQQSVNAEYVMLPYEAIADSLVKVSEDDVRAVYNEYKSYFKREPYRKIEFAFINYIPNEADFIKEAEYMASLQEEFSTYENIDDLLQEESDEGFQAVTEYTENTVPASFKEFAFDKEAKVGDCSALQREGQAYSIARIMGQDKAKKTVSLAILQRTVIPSEASKIEMEQEIKKLLSENNTVEDFEQALKQAGLYGMQMEVNKMTPTLSGLQGSRKVITWAFGVNEGTVCGEGFDCGEMMIVAAVVDAHDGSYLSFEKARQDTRYISIDRIALNNAKAAYIAKAIPSANSLEEVKAVLGQDAKSGATNVTLADKMFGAYNNEPAVVGAAFAENAAIAPIKGNNGIYFVKAGTVMNTNAEYTEEAKNSELTSLSGEILNRKYMQVWQLIIEGADATIYDLDRF